MMLINKLKTFIKRIFIVCGNYVPAPLNKYFYRISGVNFSSKNVWIGSGCFFDTKFPSNIVIEKNVCISFKVIIITHFDPTNTIKNHPIKSHSKIVHIGKNVFIGPGSIIYPGVSIGNGSLIKAGTVVNKDIPPNSIVSSSGLLHIKKLMNK